MEDLSISVIGPGGFALAGDMSFRDQDRFNAVLDEIRFGAANRVMLDLGALRRVDSFGIGLFMLAHEAALDAGKEMKLLNVGGDVARVFCLSALDNVLNIEMTDSVKPVGAGETCIKLSGRLVFSRQIEFEERLAAALEIPADKLVLDLTDLTFMDSSGLSLVMIANDEAASRGKIMRIRGVNGAPAQLLELSALDFLIEDRESR